MPEFADTQQTSDFPDPFKTLALSPNTHGIRAAQRLKMLEGEPVFSYVADGGYTEQYLSGLQVQLIPNQSLHLRAFSQYSLALLEQIEAQDFPASSYTPEPSKQSSVLLFLGRNLPESFAWIQLETPKQLQLLEQPRYLFELALALSPTPAVVRKPRAKPRLVFCASETQAFLNNAIVPQSLDDLLDLPGLSYMSELVTQVGLRLTQLPDAHFTQMSLASLRLDLLQARQTSARALLQAWKGARA